MISTGGGCPPALATPLSCRWRSGQAANGGRQVLWVDTGGRHRGGIDPDEGLALRELSCGFAACWHMLRTTACCGRFGDLGNAARLSFRHGVHLCSVACYPLPPFGERGFRAAACWSRARSRRSVDRSAAHPRRTAARGSTASGALARRKVAGAGRVGRRPGVCSRNCSRAHAAVAGFDEPDGGCGRSARLRTAMGRRSVAGRCGSPGGRRSSRWRPWSGRSLPGWGGEGGAACRASADDRAARGRRAVTHLEAMLRAWRSAIASSGETARRRAPTGRASALLEQLLRNATTKWPRELRSS